MNRHANVKNILFYEPGAAIGSQGVGGSLVSLLQLVRSLDRNRYQAVIVLRETFDLCDDYRQSGCKVIIVGGVEARSARTTGKNSITNATKRKKKIKPRLLSECKAIMQSLRKVQALKKIIEAENIDMVHLNHGLSANLEGLLAAMFCSKPFICHSRSYLSQTISPLFLYLGKKAHRHIAISQDIFDDLTKKGLPKSDIILLNNWIDTAQTPRMQIKPQSYSRGLPFHICCIGRFVPWKGQQLLVQTARELKTHGYDFRISFFGDAGTEKGRAYLKNVKQSVVDFDLEAQIRFEGYRPYHEIFDTPFHLLVHSSIQPEPFGRVIIEGMYNSIPVIGSGMGGVLDIIRHGENGLLFNPAVPGDLAEKICLLINNDALRVALGASGYTTVTDHFSEKGQREKLTEIYSA